MNISKNLIPWDDPAWLSEEDISANKIDQNTDTNNFKQFTRRTAPMVNQDTNFNNFSNDFQNNDKGKYKIDRKYKHNCSFDNSNRRNDNVRVLNNSETSINDYYQRKGNSNRDLKIEIGRNEVDTKPRKIYLSSDVTDVKETKSDIKNDCETVKGEIVDNNNDKQVIHPKDCQKKPTIQIYNPAAVRGKWSGFLADPYPDVRQEKRVVNRYPRKDDIVSGDMSGKYNQGKSQDVGMCRKNNYSANKPIEVRRNQCNSGSSSRSINVENRGNVTWREGDNQYQDRGRNYNQQNNNRGGGGQSRRFCNDGYRDNNGQCNSYSRQRNLNDPHL